MLPVGTAVKTAAFPLHPEEIPLSYTISAAFIFFTHYSLLLQFIQRGASSAACPETLFTGNQSGSFQIV